MISAENHIQLELPKRSNNKIYYIIIHNSRTCLLRVLDL